MTDKEIEDLKLENKTLTAKNTQLKKDLETMQNETINYKETMEAKLKNFGTQIAPDKIIISHDGKNYELKGKSILLPGFGKIDVEKLKDDAEKIALIIEKYPQMVTELK